MSMFIRDGILYSCLCVDVFEWFCYVCIAISVGPIIFPNVLYTLLVKCQIYRHEVFQNIPDCS